MRVAFSNYARNMNNKSNTHTTMLINVHNRMKHANTGNDNVIPLNNATPTRRTNATEARIAALVFFFI